MTGQSLSSPTKVALAAAWTAIRSRHPDLPAADVYLRPVALVSTEGGSRIGCATCVTEPVTESDENTPDRSAPRLEIEIDSTRTHLGTIGLFGVLLHEAAHVVSYVRRIQDTSRQVRYHNDRFRQAALEMELEVARNRYTGWSVTTVPRTTLTIYQDEVDQLDDSLQWWRAGDVGGNGARDGRFGGKPVRCFCGCRRSIVVRADALAVAPIVCVRCEQQFRPERRGRTPRDVAPTRDD